MIKRICEGEVMPAWYGVAWFEYSSLMVVCAPVPLNICIAAARGIWNFLRWGYQPTRMNPRDAYAQGRRDADNERRHAQRHGGGP